MTEPLQIDETESMSEATILGALNALEARLTKAEAQRAELERNIAFAKEEKQLLEKLLALRRGEHEKPELIGPAQKNSETIGHSPAGLNHPVVEAVLAELEQARRPLHISDLMRLLNERDIAIPGLGTQANLISYLRRDKRLVRPSRGMYALATSGLADIPNVARRKHRRRKIRSTGKDGGKQ
jgi:hypothetical protein